MAASDVNEIYISSSPHFSARSSTRGTMACVIITLLPLAVKGVCLYGVNALITILASVAAAVASEYIFQKINKMPVRAGDGSAIVTGLLLALVLPPTVPVWMTILGAVFAIVVAKQLFGGIGANVFNPALAGRAFMIVSFPAAVGASWMKPAVVIEAEAAARAAEALSGATAVSSATTAIDAVSSATLLSSVKAGTAAITSDTYLQYFLGNRAGCIGESSILLILIAFVILLAAKIIDWRAPVAMVGTVALCTWIAGGDVLFALLSGGLLFGATFMVTDYATAPVTSGGRLVFGAGCGLITFLIRQFGGYPEGVMFSILIMNAVAPFLNHIIPRKYGYGKKAGKGASK